MRENNMPDIIKRITNVFQNKRYRSKVDGSDKRWLDESIDEILEKILLFLTSIE
jgi:phosphoribosylformylglycinamidine (FGAM) synthase PurS component